jgi:hypothetical protein
VRAGFLVFSTLFLLFTRIKIMGAQLPVFTKYVQPDTLSFTNTCSSFLVFLHMRNTLRFTTTWSNVLVFSHMTKLVFALLYE